MTDILGKTAEKDSGNIYTETGLGEGSRSIGIDRFDSVGVRLQNSRKNTLGKVITCGPGRSAAERGKEKKLKKERPAEMGHRPASGCCLARAGEE